MITFTHRLNCTKLKDNNLVMLWKWTIVYKICVYLVFVAGVLWKDDPHVFLSTGKDQMLIQHLFNDAKRPADSVIPSGIDISIYGDMCHATRDKNNGIFCTFNVLYCKHKISERKKVFRKLLVIWRNDGVWHERSPCICTCLCLQLVLVTGCIQ